MYFIIANIPENFHSADLRNFFSEFIEKEAFNCFHFRHRPHSNLLNILNKSIILSDDGVSTGNKSDTDHKETTAPGTVNSSDKGCNSSRLSERTGESENVSVGSSTKTEGDGEGKGDSDGEASECSKTHWLSSGLAGLASLITEKKKQVKPSRKWPCDVEEGDNKTSSVKEGQNVCERDSSSKARNNSKDQPSSSLVEMLPPLQNEEASKRTCCVVEVKNSLQERFMRKYDRKHWLTRSGDILPQRCYLLRVDFRDSQTSADSEEYKTRQEHSALSLMSASMQDLLEFRPPPIMPQGNVGTPTHHFKTLIRTCQMPGTLIKKLGLEFPRARGKKRFGQVPFDYGTSVVAGQEGSEGGKEADIAFTATGHLIPTSADFEEQQRRRRRREKKRMSSRRPRVELEKEEEDGAEVEEWERYESFHEDVTSQDRIKERRFEEELEVVWEKGGSGLVFYTDAQYWRAQQGDFDEQTADEWDVDMSVYYEEGAGDKDARDSVEMTQSDKLRSGSLAPSVFVKRRGEESSTKARKRRERRIIGPTPPPTIGSFEAHTRGFGRRMMEAQGWKEGQGLGAGSAGMPYALEGDGQHPHDRKGFGYHGEKLQVWSSSSTSTTTQRPQHRHHRISTVFDRAEDADPPAPTLRTPEPTALSHRPR